MRKVDFFFAGVVFFTLVGCGGDDGGSGDDGDDGDDGGVEVSGFISEVQSEGGGTVETLTGEIPAEGDGPLATVTTSGMVINGGTVQVQIEGDGDFDRVVVAIGGAEGYFEISLPEAVAAIELLVTLSQSIGADDFDFLYAIGNGDEIGTYEEVTATVVSVGTGELQVSVSWDAPSDVDLHVIDPDGDEIYFGVPFSESGGELDLDSNPGCFIDGVNNENITWASAPAGEYQVRVDYYLSCEVEETNYVVTVQIMGEEPETFSGSFTDAGDMGGAGSGVDITSFTLE
jgi:uncharacterized protein YfaP (DUF2135 family)